MGKSTKYVGQLERWAERSHLEISRSECNGTRTIGVKDPARFATFIIDRRSNVMSFEQLAKSMLDGLRKLGCDVDRGE